MRRVAAAGGVLLSLLHRQPAGTGALSPAPQRKSAAGAGLRGAAGGAAGSGTVGDPRRPRCPDAAPDRWRPDAGARRSNGTYRPFRQLPERRLPDLVRRRRWADVPPVRLLQPLRPTAEGFLPATARSCFRPTRPVPARSACSWRTRRTPLWTCGRISVPLLAYHTVEAVAAEGSDTCTILGETDSYYNAGALLAHEHEVTSACTYNDII